VSLGGLVCDVSKEGSDLVFKGQTIKKYASCIALEEECSTPNNKTRINLQQNDIAELLL
jgi:hypothetical protein